MIVDGDIDSHEVFFLFNDNYLVEFMENLRFPSLSGILFGQFLD